MYYQRGPSVWHGLPDLRDLSKDLETWKDLPIPAWHVSHLLIVRKEKVYDMIRKELLKTTHIFGRKSIRLGSLSQTPRCQYIEHLFRPKVGFDNILHRSKTICGALGIDRKGLKILYDTGRVEREHLPTGSPRYPHWGLQTEMQAVVAGYLQAKSK